MLYWSHLTDEEIKADKKLVGGDDIDNLLFGHCFTIHKMFSTILSHMGALNDLVK